MSQGWVLIEVYIGLFHSLADLIRCDMRTHLKVLLSLESSCLTLGKLVL